MTAPVIYREDAIQSLRTKVANQDRGDDVNPIIVGTYYTRYTITSLINSDGNFSYSYIYFDVYQNNEIKVCISFTTAKALTANTTYTLVTSSYISASTSLKLGKTLYGTLYLNSNGLQWYNGGDAAESGTAGDYCFMIPASAQTYVTINSSVPSVQVSITDSAPTENTFYYASVATDNDDTQRITWNTLNLITRSYDPQYLRIEYDFTMNSSMSSNTTTQLINEGIIECEDFICWESNMCATNSESFNFWYTSLVSLLMQVVSGLSEGSTYSGSTVIMCGLSTSWSVVSVLTSSVNIITQIKNAVRSKNTSYRKTIQRAFASVWGNVGQLKADVKPLKEAAEAAESG